MLGSVIAYSVLASTPASTAATAGDAVAIAVAVVSTVVMIALCAALVYLVKAARQLRREASALANEAGQLIEEMASAVERAQEELQRVDRMVGSAEAISDVVGSASRLVGGVVADPLIKLVALGSGIAEGARHFTGAAPGPGGRPGAVPRGEKSPGLREITAGLPSGDKDRRGDAEGRRRWRFSGRK
jgi:hypothetical protein